MLGLDWAIGTQQNRASAVRRRTLRAIGSSILSSDVLPVSEPPVGGRERVRVRGRRVRLAPLAILELLAVDRSDGVRSVDISCADDDAWSFMVNTI